MPIDKDNSEPVKLMIKTTYGPVLERTLLTFILKDLAEIITTMRVAPNDNLSFKAYMQAREEAIHSPQVKRSLLVRLNALKHMRYELVEEVLKQYNLKLPNDEISFYHDVMEELLQGYEKHIETWIGGGHYEALSKRLNQLTMH